MWCCMLMEQPHPPTPSLCALKALDQAVGAAATAVSSPWTVPPLTSQWLPTAMASSKPSRPSMPPGLRAMSSTCRCSRAVPKPSHPFYVIAATELYFSSTCVARALDRSHTSPLVCMKWTRCRRSGSCSRLRRRTTRSGALLHLFPQMGSLRHLSRSATNRTPHSLRVSVRPCPTVPLPAAPRVWLHRPRRLALLSYARDVAATTPPSCTLSQSYPTRSAGKVCSRRRMRRASLPGWPRSHSLMRRTSSRATRTWSQPTPPPSPTPSPPPTSPHDLAAAKR